MKILLIGYGRMGRLIEQTAAAAGDTVAAVVDIDTIGNLETMDRVADVAVDFSNPAALPAVAAYVRRTGTPLLSGTTGMTDAGFAVLDELGQYAPVLHSANYSVGVAVFRRALEAVSDVLKPDFDIEIMETHHNQKVDAPSGTALALADSINEECGNTYEYIYDRSQRREKRDKKEIGISAVRGGTIVGDHDVIFAGEDEVITFSHSAYSKAVFAKGAVQAGKFLAGKPAGMYNMSHVIDAQL